MDMDPAPQDVARTLTLLREGDPEASSRLMAMVYEPLRALAGSYFRRQPSHHTLQPTALVHEAFLKVLNGQATGWNDRAHFLAVCAQAMRGILVDHARRKASSKHGGGLHRVPLDGATVTEPARDVDLLDLERHLAHLATLNERQARVVECRFYSGMTIAEVAEVLGVSERTVDGDWAMARAWLGVRLKGDE